MSWSLITTTAILFVVGVTCTPVDISTPATELLPPKVEDEPTLATDLVPPPLPEEDDKESDESKKTPVTLFLINVFAVKNSTGEESNDVLRNEVIEEVPEDAADPLAVFLLVVEDDDEKKPVSLDEVAKELEDEGFSVEKIKKDGETRIVKVDLTSVDDSESSETTTEEPTTTTEIAVTEEQPKLDDSGKLLKVRRKRTLCLKCMVDDLKSMKYGHGHGGGCGGGCGGGGGGGYYPPPPVQYEPIAVVPVVVGGGGGGGGYHKPNYYPPPQPHYQQPCNTCGGGGGGYGNGGGNSYAQASAQASAQSSSYGR